MTDADGHRVALEVLSRQLRDLHRQILEVERGFHPDMRALQLMDRLVNDPQWAWLRPLSELITNIDHVLAGGELSDNDAAVVAARARALLSGEGATEPLAFLERYRALLQTDITLASMHGQLKVGLASLPAESENESDRLHARHQFAMRCKHRVPR